MFLDNIYLILLVPFWIFLIIMLGRFVSVYVNNNIINIVTLISSLFGAIICGGALWKIEPDKILDYEIPFLKVNDFIINCGLHVDRTALVFALVLFLVSFFVQFFATSYMSKDKKSYRFFALLNLFNFSMAGLFFSSNMFQTYLFWELSGLVSYLLIGYDYSNDKKSTASKKVFIINRIGDTAFLCSIILCSYFLYMYAPSKSLATLSFIDINTISTLVYAYTSTPLFELVCLLFMISAFVKSALFPFYNWLQDAMEAKLPVSALLHSATLLAAGIFLTLRLLPFYTLEGYLLKIITLVGLLTAGVCSISACSQTNPKKVLAYSSSAHMGLIYFAIGCLNIKVAIVLFIAHAFIKSMLFLALPEYNEKWNYFKFILFLLASLSLSGLIFSGMVAKELLVLNMSTKGLIFVSLLSFITAFYILRISLVIFDKQGYEKLLSNKTQLISIIGLFLLNVVFYIYLHLNMEYKVAEPFWAALTAWICVYILYTKNAFWRVPILYQLSYNGFYLDSFYKNFCHFIYEPVSNLCNYVDKKVFGNYCIPISFARFGVKFFGFIESSIMNKSVKLITMFFRKFSTIDAKAQSGNIQSYNIYAFIIISIILTLLILGYTLMLINLGG